LSAAAAGGGRKIKHLLERGFRRVGKKRHHQRWALPCRRRHVQVIVRHAGPRQLHSCRRDPEKGRGEKKRKKERKKKRATRSAKHTHRKLASPQFLSPRAVLTSNNQTKRTNNITTPQCQDPKTSSRSKQASKPQAHRSFFSLTPSYPALGAGSSARRMRAAEETWAPRGRRSAAWYQGPRSTRASRRDCSSHRSC
jgi:hypothetical protein